MNQEESVQTIAELLDYMTEQSRSVDRCRKLSDSWDFAAQEIARELGIGANQVEEAFNSLARQMIRLGREAIEDGWITRESWRRFISRFPNTA